ncbi:hypothetical protein VC83_01540 [Pseudogymnoascus destructans]|uniref:Uncharacterized protein n=1 Tax=Pseudogymnoascus destructans TaxID=655981 RepID=A0A177AIS2_9PEZI|nr:uncharacterized protein VC83_01540 [Pseudogymnoascus destructans]OAF61966.1 hypothetical protein VC83_01540 [Pseudogymnoascus destructans]
MSRFRRGPDAGMAAEVMRRNFGAGTRDKAAMSRKDPRKYKRRGGGALAKKKD